MNWYEADIRKEGHLYGFVVGTIERAVHDLAKHHSDPGTVIGVHEVPIGVINGSDVPLEGGVYMRLPHEPWKRVDASSLLSKPGLDATITGGSAFQAGRA